jgi:dCMP deaminase
MPIQSSTFMKIAQVLAQESKAVNAKVGAIAVRDGRIVATGYNGTPPGFNNVCEGHDGITKKEVIHAESNIVAFAGKHGVSLRGADVYCTLSPCVPCAALLSAAGVSRYYYRDAYRDSTGLHLLADLGIEAIHVDG